MVAVFSVALQTHRRCIESGENGIDREIEYKERTEKLEEKRNGIRPGRA